MSSVGVFCKFINNIECYVCRLLLALFVVLLFAQIVSRELFEYSFSWSEELATYMFVWFVFFGASYATKLSAHNRVTFQFKLFSPKAAVIFEAVSDFIWLLFNCYFVYLSFDFVFFKMNLFWTSQTLGVPMKYFYLVLPLSFTLMSIRIIQVNYYKLFKSINIRDPEAVEMDKILKTNAKDISKTITTDEANKAKT